MRITVDPSTEAGGFGYAAAGRYTLRVAAIEYKTKEYPYLKWTLNFADPSVKSVTPGFKVGSIFENTTLKTGENAQFKLRQICDALGVTWGDFDTESVIGQELEAEVGMHEYNGNFTNEVKKYIPRKK